MIYLYSYLGAGAVVSAIALIVHANSRGGMLGRIWSFLVGVALWPLISLVLISEFLTERQKRHAAGPADQHPLYGGDGLTSETAVVVNCASMATADTLINRFITQKHGQQGWQRGLEMALTPASSPSKTIRSVVITLADKTQTTYYFDITRPATATMKLVQLMAKRSPEGSNTVSP
jgi:hypothetical protein